jgi:UDP-glucose:(heptosyl)LPS alpha-1,3-glucosyltransferase
MRIALVHMRQAAIGGTELVLDTLAAHLAELGHAVTIVCRSHESEVHPRVEFAVLRSFAIGGAWRMWAFAADVERHVANANYDVVVGLGKTWTHDVVRTGGGSHATFVARAHVFEGRSTTLKDLLALKIERRGFAPGNYKRVIANSRMVARDIAARYAVPENDIEVVYNGVDLERFHPREREHGRELRRALDLGDEHCVFLFLGSGFRRKGLERTLRAFREVSAARPDARLLVVGGDSTRAAHERIARELGIDASVRFVGVRRDAPACFAASDVHVLPTWYDSFGFTVLEALASGVPVITTDAAGAAELVDDGVHGAVLRGECTSDELAAAMLAWSDRERVRAAAAPARQRAELHGFARTMQQMTRVLLEVAARRA